MVDLGSRVKDSGTNTDSGMWLKSSLGSIVGFGSKVGSKSKNWSLHSWSINGMCVPKIGGSILSSIGTWINVGSGIGYQSQHGFENWNWITKLGIGSHSYSSSIFLKWKLVNLSKAWDWSSSTCCGGIES